MTTAPGNLVRMQSHAVGWRIALIGCVAGLVGCAQGAAAPYFAALEAADSDRPTGDDATPDGGVGPARSWDNSIDAGSAGTDDSRTTKPGSPNCGGTDSDGDGSPDCADACPDDSHKTKPGPCGCGKTDTDEDRDGTLDCDDVCPTDATKQDDEGECGCDVAEADRDADGTPDCTDMCPEDPDKTEAGDCGCGRVDEDRNADGKADCAVFEDGLVAAAFSHSCALGSNAKAYCWGAAGYGRLGSGDGVASNTPVAVVGLTDVVQVSSRGVDDIATSCAVLAAGGVRCWGYGAAGTMGNGSTTAANNSPVAVTGIVDALQVSAGTRHVCAVRSSGAVACWGLGALGRLGNGDSIDASTPVAVQGIDDALQVSASYENTCAARASGKVSCWGDRSYGRIGDGGAVAGSQLTPAMVSGLSDARQVSVGYQHSCAVLASGKVMCWGLRNNARIGDGGPASGNQLTPVAVTGITDATQVSAGYLHSCAVLASGKVMCWGYRVGGRMGDGDSAGGDQATPIAVMGITDAVQVVASYEHSCAKSAKGPVLCWGGNGSGRLGDGTTTVAYAPVKVSALP